MPPMRYERGSIAMGAAALLLAALGVGCSTVPYTNRSQLILMSESEDLELGAAAYREALKKAKVVHDPAVTGVVQRVGRRIAAASGKSDYHWEFTVVDDPRQANAFCLPGGKVAVYTGIFPIARDEDGLAAVIGHEVAHALARHGAERVSQGVLINVAGVGVAAAAGGSSPAVQRSVMQAYGLGAQLGWALPFSRSQESEADYIGLILMAKAGYDPEAAIALWKRMEAASQGKSPPQWLSTHPSAETRQEDIRQWLAEARRYYVPNGEGTVPLPPIPGAAGDNRGAAGTGEPHFR